jgi:O26-antigen biosynthesis N-acetyl-L-fucosamine transferase
VNKLRILILVDCYFPSIKSSAKLTHDLAVELERRGNKVIVLTPTECRTTATVEEGVSVIRVKAGKIKGAGKVRRAINEARLSANLWWKARRFLHQNPCELIIFYSPTIFFGSLVARLKRLWRCPAYLILRDIFPDWAVDAGILRKGLVYHFFRKVASIQYQVADLIAVQSPGNLSYFNKRFPKKPFRLKVLFNWTAVSEPHVVHKNYRRQLGLNDKIIFFYGGNIGVAQDMDNIVRLAKRLASRTDIHFLLVGDGDEVARLNSEIEQSKLQNLKILPGVSQEDYFSMVSEFDVGLISLDSRLTSHNVPGKLLSYLYWGLPVLASVNLGNDLFSLINDSQAGFCFSNGDEENLYSAALRLADDAHLRHAWGRNGRQLLENTFSVEHAVNQIFDQLYDEGILLRHPTNRCGLPNQREFARNFNT